MSVIFSIGRQLWLCESATKAGKIADLLSSCEPLKQVYDAGSHPEVFFKGRGYEHKVEITEVDNDMLVTASDAKVQELRRAYLLGKEDASPKAKNL